MTEAFSIRKLVMAGGGAESASRSRPTLAPGSAGYRATSKMDSLPVLVPTGTQSHTGAVIVRLAGGRLAGGSP